MKILSTSIDDHGHQLADLRGLCSGAAGYRHIATRSIVARLHENWGEEFSDVERLFAEILANPGQVRRGGRGEGTSSYRDINGRPYFIKVYSACTIRRRLREVIGHHRALREWQRTVRAAEAGVDTAPMVLALAERKGWSARNLVITCPAAGIALNRIFEQKESAPMGLSELIALLAAQTAHYHRLGFFHRHLKATHLFLRADRTFTCIDLEGSLIRKPLPRHLRLDNLRQMRRSLERYDLTRDRFAEYKGAYEEAWASAMTGVSN